MAKDELLEIELLLNKDVLDLLDGFPQRFDDVSAPTIKANKSYSLQYNMAVALKEGTRILLIAFPMLFLVLYSAYGREKSFVVPKYLSRIPYKERKPWIVNLVFKSDALDYDENGLYATILDLHRKGKIRMDTKKGGLTIKILDPESSDEYERRVLQFLQGLSKEGVVDKYDIKEQTKTLTSSASFEPRLRYLQGEMAYLTKNPDKSVAQEFMVNGRRKVVPFIVVSVILFLSSLISYSIFSNVASILRFSIVTSIILLIQSIIAIVFPSTLFGKWRGAAYKEKLEWDSFKRFLSDLALIKKYAPQDLSMWGQWLVFGTSLGVGKNVVKAMKKLKIPLEEANFAPAIPLLFRPIMVATLPSQSGARGGGGFGGGGFGAGGGFGGGGGGARFYRVYS